MTGASLTLGKVNQMLIPKLGLNLSLLFAFAPGAFDSVSVSGFGNRRMKQSDVSCETLSKDMDRRQRGLQLFVFVLICLISQRFLLHGM
jgi:hypothetical protein